MNQTHSTCDSVEPQKCGILKRTLQVMFTCARLFIFSAASTQTPVFYLS
jgi:hypothetical protein